MTLIELIKSVIGINVPDFDMVIVMFACAMLLISMVWIYALLTVPINIITNAFQRKKD